MNNLKILCISDQVDPLIYSNNIKKRFGNIDIILSAGDLDLDYYGFIVSSLNKPLLFVFGNHNLKLLKGFRKKNNDFPAKFPPDNSNIIPRSFGSIYVGDKVKNVKTVIIAGLGGSMKYNGGDNQFSEFSMTLKILKIFPGLLFNRIFRGRWLDILLTHAPPRGLGDREDLCHRGFRVFRVFLRIFKPAYHIHGHIHLYDMNSPREISFFKTRIINVFEHKIIEIEVS